MLQFCFQATRFRLFLVMSWLIAGYCPLNAQPVPNSRESGVFWASKGQRLMRASQYAEAYTAFQLARSLGAPDMAAQMALAKKRNINSIQLRALVAEARAQAATDPTQSLRLLEYARSQFPDSSSLLRAIGDIVNQPDNWYYALRADSLKASPRFTYLLSDTDKCRLYRRKGDSLSLIHTFTERPWLRVFSGDDRYLFVSSGRQQKGELYALDSGSPKRVRTYGNSVTNVRFSPGYAPAWDYLLVEYNGNRMVLQHRGVPVFSTAFQWRANCAFSPTGRYVTTPKGLYQLSSTGIRLVPLQVTANEWIGRFDYSWFSDHDQNLLTTQYTVAIGTWENGSQSIQTALYRLPEQPPTKPVDSVRIERLLDSYMLTPRRMWEPFSPDGHYYCLKGKPDSSLFYSDQGRWQPILLTSTSPDSTRKNDFVNIRFSPSGQHVLVAFTNKKSTQLWKLDGVQTRLIHEFDQPPSLYDDVFSPDGTYLLARHAEQDDNRTWKTDRLWHIANDTVRLLHTFGRPLQEPSVFDVDGYPVGASYFSPDSRYLLTYAATALTADSLWQISAETLRPIHGFSNRLRAVSTAFSPDGRYLLISGNGKQPATLWNLSLQQPLMAPNLLSATEALFSPKGNYLLTDSTLWQVTNRTLQPRRLPTEFTSLVNCQFSPDERYVVYSGDKRFMTQSGEQYVANAGLTRPGESPITTLYASVTDGLKPVGAVENDVLRYAISEGGIAIRTFQSGVFVPDGSGWLSSLLPVDSAHLLRPDSVWRLLPAGASGNTGMLGQTTRRVDKLIVNTAGYSVYQRWHIAPAALFSHDGRFLLTKEQDSLRFYTMQPVMRAGTFLPGVTGWPIDVSGQADYWLTRTDFLNDYIDQLPVHERYKVDYPLSDTPDTLRVWRRMGTNWKSIAVISDLYKGMNLNWQGNRRPGWFSGAGNYLLVPTTKPGLTTLYQLTGDAIRPVLNLNAQLLTAAHIVPSRQDGWDAGLLYTDISQQTYLLRYGATGTRKTNLGFGVLEHPPRFQGKLAYWVRKVDDSQQNLEILDMATTTTLVQVPFGSVLDVTVRPNGDAWVVSTAGARLVRSPETTLRWLKQVPVAPLQPAFRQLYGFQ